MYIFYHGRDGRYASAGISKRNGKKTSVDSIYLGRVLDKEAGIYKSKSRGIFHFDPHTGEFSAPPESYVPPKIEDRRKRKAGSETDL